MMRKKLQQGGMERPRELGWRELDMVRFVSTGIGVFSLVTTALFPLSVLKTRMMAMDSQGRGGLGFGAVGAAAREILRAEGVPGFYRGFTTVVLGIIPARVLYMTTLEGTKGLVRAALVPGSQELSAPAARRCWRAWL